MDLGSVRVSAGVKVWLALTFDKALPSCSLSEEEECVHPAWVSSQEGLPFAYFELKVKVNKSVSIRG